MKEKNLDNETPAAQQKVTSRGQIVPTLSILFNCLLMQNHKWTCNAEQGIKATPGQLQGGVEGFLDYATMYCARCGKVSDLSKAHQMVCSRQIK